MCKTPFANAVTFKPQQPPSPTVALYGVEDNTSVQYITWI